ncbi:MAG: hypothetical protein P1U56_09645 [Saprospiraceae bacterium]|nr:hypothetical protein [Saprospiraceae bacterium]
MRKNILFVCSILFSVQLLGQQYKDEKGNMHLWGTCNLEELFAEPYHDWYQKSSEDYSSTLTEEDGKLFADVGVKIFIGTWCGDTKFLVPKFVKTWESMGLDIENLQFIALHNKDEYYKQGPNNETHGLNIHKVPTFIFEKEGEEIGRIVERTIFNLDTDMLQIAKGNPYEERYQGVSILNDLLLEIPADSLFTKNTLNESYKKIRREISTFSELNAFGYVLKAQGALKKAEFVFLLNRYLFPYNPNVRDSYGEILMNLSRWEDAKEQYEEVIRLKGSDSNAVEKLNEIYTELATMDQPK